MDKYVDMAAAGVSRNVEPFKFRTLDKYPEYNASNESESESEPEPEQESTKPKSKWIENDDDVYTENDPAYLVLYDYAKGKKPCMPYTDETGTTYYVHVFTTRPQKIYSVSIEDFRKRYLPIRKTIHDLTQYYDVTTFPDAPDGIYTWIVGDKGKFLAGRVRSILEMGTLHKQLADVSKSKHIYVAGECSKKGNEVYFNIQSGTFSLAIIRRKNKSRLNEATKQQLLQAKGQSIFESMGLTPIAFGGTYSLINPRSTPITKEELQQYVQAGFDVYLYEKREDCKSDLFTTTFPKAIRFQEGGSKRTRRRMRCRSSTRKQRK